MQRADLGRKVDVDCRIRLDLIDEVARHARPQISTAHDEVDVTAATREEDGGLAGRIRAAHHNDGIALTRLRLDLRGGVIDPHALEIGESVDGQSAIPGARRHNGRAPPQALASLERDHMVTILET